MHILILGAAGMIGRKLTARLVADGNVGGSAIERLTLADVIPPQQPENATGEVELVATDLSVAGEADRLVAGRPDVILHLAAIVSSDAEANFDKGYRVNLDGTGPSSTPYGPRIPPMGTHPVWSSPRRMRSTGRRSPTPAVQDTPATLTARIGAVAPGSGAPTGTVTFTANGDPFGGAPLQPVSGGAEAAIDISDLPAGEYTIIATYAGDGNYNGSESAPITHEVIAAAAVVETSTVVTSSENPSTYGELITFTAEVTAVDDTTPAGTVQFSLDGADFGDPVPVGPDGIAESATLASPDPGDHTVIAAFTGAVGYSGSGDFLTQTVDAAGVDVGITSSDASSDYGQAVTFSATITSQQVGTGSPSGYVQFVLDGQPLGDAVELDGDGQGTSQAVSNLSPGDHDVRALYSGDVHFVSGANTITQNVAKVATTTVVTATPTSSTYGQTVQLSAKVTPAVGTAGTPGGTVTFKRGTTTIASVPVAAGPGSSAVAVINVSDLPAGSHAIRAEYSGTALFAASTSAPVTVNVGKVGTVLNAQAALVKIIPLGLPLGLLKTTLTTSAGAPVVGQPVQFRIGPNLICTSLTDAQGVATCNARPQLLQLTLALGYKAAYLGDANHLPSNANGSIIK